jgi:RNA polymerase sigma-70 factor (ECF subfamily)
MAEETSIGGTESRFQSTLWETVLKAKEGSKDALDRLLEDYWKPVYFFIRRKGYDVEAAKDLTQGFLGVFLEKNYLGQVTPERGRFRSYIMACVQHYLSNERDRAQTLKRGGGFNFVQAENDLPSAAAGPEQAFFKGWALTILERAMARVAEEVPPEDLAMLSGVMPAGISASEKKNRLHQLRLKIRRHLREGILLASDNEAEVDSEIRLILSFLN